MRSEQIRWCLDIANALAYVHQHSVRHADLTGRNLLLDADRNILRCNISGSSVEGDDAMGDRGSRAPPSGPEDLEEGKYPDVTNSDITPATRLPNAGRDKLGSEAEAAGEIAQLGTFPYKFIDRHTNHVVQTLSDQDG
ncbi:hypothetical protein VTI74DRAFT_617 [Chaetomium olivicolor]